MNNEFMERHHIHNQTLTYDSFCLTCERRVDANVVSKTIAAVAVMKK